MIGVPQGRRVRGGVVVLAVLALSACLAAVVWTTTAAGEPSYTESAPLPPYEAGGPEPVALDDGGEVSVTKDADDDFVVQWRDPDGTRWSEPQDVGLSQAGLEGRDATITARGDTVALSLSWYADDDDARENSALDAAVVCRDHVCDVVARDTWLSPYLTEDGERALVARRVESYSVVPDGATYELLAWRADDDEWEQVRVDSPASDERTLRPELVMLGDGTLATVRAVLDEAGLGCRYELWASEPPADPDDDLGTDLEVQHVIDAPGDASCTTGSPTPGTPDDPTDPTSISFTPTGLDQTVTVSRTTDGWSDTAPAAEDGLLPAGPGGLGMVQADVGGGTTAVGSDDGRRIVQQYREAGETSWTRPVVLARARPGERCRTFTPEDEDGEVVVAVSCWPTDSRWGSLYDGTPPPTSGFALGTSDGRTWDVVPLDLPAYEPVALDRAGLLVRGGDRSALWRPGSSSFTEIRLPLPTPTVDALEIAGDQAVRVTGNEDADARCRPTWSTAPLDATSWQRNGDITPVPAYARDLRRCYGVVFDRAVTGYGGRPGRQLEVAAVGVDDQVARIEGRLARLDEGWVFRPGER